MLRIYSETTASPSSASRPGKGLNKGLLSPTSLALFAAHS